MNKHEQYEAWIAECYEALRDNMPEFAGKPTDKRGDFENVGFHLGADYGDVGKHGAIIVAFSLKGPKKSGKGKQQQVKGNWHWDDPEKVATAAIAAYIKLREQLP